jgi:hypothetical protein
MPRRITKSVGAARLVSAAALGRAAAEFAAPPDPGRASCDQQFNLAVWFGGLLLATYTLTLGALGTRITMRRDLT